MILIFSAVYIEAKCSCGFNVTMNLGGGKANYKTFCGFPYYCKSCISLIGIIYLKEEKKPKLITSAL